MRFDYSKLPSVAILAFSEEAEKEYEKEQEDKDKEEETDDESVDTDVEDDNNTEEEENTDDDTETISSFEDSLDLDDDFSMDDDQSGEDFDYDPNAEYTDDMGTSDEFTDEDREGLITDGPTTEEKPIKKIQTVDVLTKVTAKFDELMNKVDKVTWGELVLNKSSKKSKILTYWNYVEDMHKAINKILGSENLIYVDIYNNLFDKLSEGSPWTTGLAVYSTQNMGDPFITEGMYLLMYELSFDWAAFLIRYLYDNPEINADDFENDSFVRRFPNLTLLTYIASLLVDSEEFDKFMTSQDAFDLVADETEYNLTFKQVKEKQDMIRTAGESLSYFANLVTNNYSDLVAGVLDKLGVVVYLHTTCKVNFTERLNIISELIKAIASRKPLQNNVDGTPNNYNTMFKVITTLSDNLVIARQEARMLMDANKDNFILQITNN